jgi:hypothetical protein
MEGGVFGMAAVVEESFRRLLAVVNLGEDGSDRMRFSEVGAQSTLTCMDRDHSSGSFSRYELVCRHHWIMMMTYAAQYV